MNTANQYKDLVEALDQYLLRALRYTAEDFIKSPAPGKWSIAQVYAHIITADELTVKGIQRCLKGEARQTSKKPNIAGKLLLFFGIFPPFRIPAPRFLEEATILFSREEACEKLELLKADLQTIMEAGSWPSDRKFRHPFLGPMNTRQWIRFMQIHSRHHLKQLYRTEKMLGL